MNINFLKAIQVFTFYERIKEKKIKKHFSSLNFHCREKSSLSREKSLFNSLKHFLKLVPILFQLPFLIFFHFLRQSKNSTTAGFEPAREDPKRFLVFRLNHSATLSSYLCSHFSISKFKPR